MPRRWRVRFPSASATSADSAYVLAREVTSAAGERPPPACVTHSGAALIPSRDGLWTPSERMRQDGRLLSQGGAMADGQWPGQNGQQDDTQGTGRYGRQAGSDGRWRFGGDKNRMWSQGSVYRDPRRSLISPDARPRSRAATRPLPEPTGGRRPRCGCRSTGSRPPSCRPGRPPAP